MNNPTHFDRNKMPLPRSFWERELGRLGRPDRRGWMLVRAGCPMHDSRSKKSFFVNLDGGFYCFGCDFSGGDLIEFLRKRHSMTFKAACEELGCWQENCQAAGRRSDPDRQRREEERKAQAERQRRIAVRNHLHSLEATYRKAQKEHDIELMSELLPDIREVEGQYWKLAGFDGGTHEL